MIERVITDVRHAVRTLLAAPTFTAAVVGTIALAVGATTAIFAVIDTILLRPLPFDDSEQVVALCETNAAIGTWCGASPMNVADWARLSSTLQEAGVARTESFVAQDASGSYGGMGGIATPGFFEVLRVRPLLGRLLEARDLPRGSNHVAVVSREFWLARLGGDPAVVGRSIQLDQGAFTVVGVLPAGAWMPDPFGDVQLWKPLTASIDNVENRRWRGFTALGRMRPGVSTETLQADLSVIGSQLAAAHPEANREWGIRVVPLRDTTVGDVRATLWIFLGTAGIVLLMASANVAGLLLVRATRRRAEFAVRASLGAGRARLVQQLLTESLVLTLAGGALGLLLAAVAIGRFVALAPPGLPRVAEVAIDGRVVLFALGLSLVVAMVFGVAPAERARQTDLNAALKGLGGGTARDVRLRAAFTTLQLALALVLLFGAGLLTRTFARWTQWDPGFDATRVRTTWMLPPRTGDGEATVALMLRVRDAVAQVPGVQAAGLGSAGPLFGGDETDGIAIEGRAPFAPDRMPTVQWFDIDAHYFEALGVRILRGRALDEGDTFGAPHVAVVNDTLARRFFPEGDALGQRVTVQDHPAEIVGIVADTTPVRPDEVPPPQIYWPIQQYRRSAAFLVVRVDPGIAGVERALEARVASIDPHIQLGRVVGLDERFAARLVSPRFNMVLLACFALVAVVLAAVGVYGVTAYGVSLRTREFGVRVALGATPGQLMRGVLQGALRLALVGILIGCAGALLGGRLLAGMLYGLSARDPLTLAASAAVLVVISAIASLSPARRASQVNPVEALRV